jgi:hypothetical protein
MATLKHTLIAMITFLMLGFIAQAQKFYQSASVRETEAYIVAKGNEFFLIGGYLYDGMDKMLLERLKLKKKVRLLTTKADAVRYNNLAKAGAEIRYGNGNTQLGRMLIIPNYVVMLKDGKFLFIEGYEVSAPIQQRLESVWNIASPYRPN